MNLFKFFAFLVLIGLLISSLNVSHEVASAIAKGFLFGFVSVGLWMLGDVGVEE